MKSAISGTSSSSQPAPKVGCGSLQAILTALHDCYGNLDSPSFHKVSELLENDPFRPLIATIQSAGIEVVDTTDPNDDVSIRLVLERSGDHLGLALSGVGPFAALIHEEPAEHYTWVTRPKGAPTPLAATVAHIVQQAGFELLDRSLVSQVVKMNWYDGSTEVTLYQALFSDYDIIP